MLPYAIFVSGHAKSAFGARLGAPCVGRRRSHQNDGKMAGDARSNVREVTISLLRQLGMTTVFGNPGSTELRFLKNWPPDFRYVLGLHEGPVVAMADAYAQLTRNAAFVNLHSAGGVGNAMGAISSAFRNYAPLVIVAGQQTRAMLPSEPFLYAADSTVLPQPYIKWGQEPARPQDVPTAILRAYTVAMERPYGPTFVSVPEDDWDRDASAVAVRRVVSDPVPDRVVLDEVSAALNASRTPALVVGSGADRDDAAPDVVRLAEALDAPVWASALSGRCGFPEDHRLFAGALPRVRSGVVESLRGQDLVLVLGAPVFNYHIHHDGPFIAEGTVLIGVTDDPRLAAAAVAGTSIVAALGPTVRALLPRIAPRPASRPARVRARAERGEFITIELLLEVVAAKLPRDAIVVEEAPSTHTMLHDLLPLQPGRFLTCASGSLGYGLPAAAGAALAAPGRRVVAIIGDGSVHYAAPGLWTAARHGLPITYLIVNNEGYGAMRSFADLIGAERLPDFAVGGVDFSALAAAYGLPARRVERSAELAPALDESFALAGPSLIDVVVDSAARKLF
jgi:benzoylformate decarboxylase